MMKRIAAGLIGAVAALGIGAGVAHADGNDVEGFLAYVETYGGVVNDTPTLQAKTIEIGYAVCELYDVGGTYQDAVETLTNDIYALAAPMYLCTEHAGVPYVSNGPMRDPITGRYRDGDGEVCLDGDKKYSEDSGITYTCSSGQWREGPTLIPLR